MRRTDAREADRLLSLATPTGKRRVVARGVRKTTSRLAGHIELFTHVQVLLAVGRTLDIVTQSQRINAFAALRTDLQRLSYAYYAADLYEACSRDDEETPALFEVLRDTMAALNSTSQPELLLRAYELRLLHVIGYRPQLQRCAICHDLLTEAAAHFSPALGGVLCPRDAHADRHALPMSTSAFKLLRYIQREPYAVVEQLRISDDIRAEAAYLLRTYITRILERNLKSVAFLESLQRQAVLGSSPNA